MTEIIKVNYDSEQPTVLGRDLHEALGIKTAYKDWFPRMCEYGFEEGKDFCSFLSESTGGRRSTDHQITIPMAKEICMIQRTDIGKKYRQYFITIEDKWNDPDAVMARALQIANKKLDEAKMLVAAKDEEIAEMKPKVSYYDVILNCKDLVSVTQIAKDYGKPATWLNGILSELLVQYRENGRWVLSDDYKDDGYVKYVPMTFGGRKMPKFTVNHMYWTYKGKRFIYNLLKGDGILPLDEQDNKGAENNE